MPLADATGQVSRDRKRGRPGLGVLGLTRTGRLYSKIRATACGVGAASRRMPESTGSPKTGNPWCEIAPCLWLTPRARFPEIENAYAQGLEFWADPYGQAVFKDSGRRPVASALRLVACRIHG